MSGNKESLSKPGIERELVNFHKKWYSSNIMCLTLQSNQSLEKLKILARDKFKKIKNKNVKIPNLVDPMPFT